MVASQAAGFGSPFIAAVVCGQTVIYDTLSITNQNLYDRAFGDCIGTSPGNAFIYDLQLAEDFVLAERTTLTRVMADYTASVAAHPIEAVWVQIFANVDGAPSNTIAHDFIARSDSYAAIDLGMLNTPAPNNFGVRFSVDMTSAGITLDAGTWWISVQPVEIETVGWYWILRDFDQLIGFDNFGRNGGTHHTGEFGGFPGPLLPQYSDWTRLGDIGFRAGSVPMRIEGATPGCAADFNDDGVLDFFDYLDFVAAFSSSAAAADFNGDGVIDFFDYLDFVAAFSSGC